MQSSSIIRTLTKKRSAEPALCILIENGTPCTQPIASRGLCDKHEAYLRKLGRYEEFALLRRARKLAYAVKALPEPGLCRLTLTTQDVGIGHINQNKYQAYDRAGRSRDRHQ